MISKNYDLVSDLQLKTLPEPSSRPFSLSHLFSAYLHPWQTSPRYINFKMVLMAQIIDPLIWLVQNVFYSIVDCFCQRHSLFYTEWASLNHMGYYIHQFNQAANHQALFLNPLSCMLDQNGPDWNQPYQNAKSVFSRFVEHLTDDFPQENLMEQGRLRHALATKNKTMLAMLINHHHHWTVIHIHFKDNTITYVDSRGAYAGNKETEALVQQRLNQIKQWMEQLDGQSWMLRGDKGSTPSALHKCQQYDWWNCGPFVMEFTHLVANENKSYQEIDQIPFAEMQRRVHARRLRMMESLATLTVPGL